jgi:3-hydroxypropanoate dehydrogenase
MSENRIIDDRALDILFRNARTHRAWQDKDVPDVLLQAIYDLAKLGPTAANICPMRIVFVKSPQAKEALRPHLDKGNVDRVMTAPVTALIAQDMEFYTKMDYLAPQAPSARSWYEGKEASIAENAARNSSLQGAYLMMAARSLGLDCGPMSGFDKKGVKDTFFAGQPVELNFICNMGYGDANSLKSRSPRFDFDSVCEII